MVQQKIVWIWLFLLAGSLGFAQGEADKKGSLDHPLVTRMPGYYISGYEVMEFDKYTSPYLSGKDETWEVREVAESGVEGGAGGDEGDEVAADPGGDGEVED